MPRVIYQIVNFTTEEVYVGMTNLSLKKKYEAISSDPPPSLKQWAFDVEDIKATIVDEFENDEDGVAFFKGFWHAMSHSSWKTIHCDEDCVDREEHGPCDMNCDAVRKDKQP